MKSVILSTTEAAYVGVSEVVKKISISTSDVYGDQGTVTHQN